MWCGNYRYPCSSYPRSFVLWLLSSCYWPATFAAPCCRPRCGSGNYKFPYWPNCPLLYLLLLGSRYSVARKNRKQVRYKSKSTYDTSLAPDVALAAWQREMDKAVSCTRKKKYWLSWELNPDHLPSVCNQQDLHGRGPTIRPLCLVDVPKRRACSCASFSLLVGGI